MFHLLKRTTMVPDFMARQAGSDDVVISQWKDYQYMYDIDIVKKHIHSNNQFNTFEEWYNQFEDDLAFVKWISDNKYRGLQIYADSQSYAKIVTKWVSFISPSLTVDQVYQIYKLSTLWFYTYQVHMRMNTTDSALVEQNDLINHFKTLSLDEFKQIYSQAQFKQSEKVRELKDSIKNYISNEYKYAFFLNGDESFRSIVEEHVDKALVSCLKMEIEQYKYVSLFDILYDNVDKSVDQIDDHLFDIIKQVSDTKSNDQVIETCVEQLYQYGITNAKQLLTHNNVLVEEYHNVLLNDKTLADKLEFISNIAADGVKKSEFVDCFSTSYMLYNLLLIRWIITLYRSKDQSLKNFVY